jgi:xanthine dehydrogenase molybdopterin-binding subunit B
VPHNYPLETLEPGLEETAFYDPANFTYPAGAYACEVEVDPDTGRVEVMSFTCADDFGNVMNPMIVEGQVHGGVAQGIGQALIEACAYGCPVLMGRSTYNFSQAVEDAVQAQAARLIDSAEHGAALALQLLAAPGELLPMRKAAEQFCHLHRGATERTLETLARERLA